MLTVSLVFISAILYTVTAFLYSPRPYTGMYFYILIYWAVHFLYLMLRVRMTALRVLFSNLAILLILLALFEGVVSFTNIPRERFDASYSSNNYDEALGIIPAKGKKIHSKRYYDNAPVYDVIYSIDENGLRVTPDFEISADNPPVLFFGCSNTFGDGLDDHQTLPYLVGSSLKSKVYNFAFVGYGPHQMLSAIEHGLVEKTVKGNPSHTIFPTALYHVERVAGHSSWAFHHPKFYLASDGHPKYAGNFDDYLMYRISRYFLERSAVYTKFFQNYYHFTNKGIDLYLAVVIESKRKLLQKYPGMEFHVLYWISRAGTRKTLDEYIVSKFREEGIKVHLVEDILPGFFTDGLKYQISANEPHPSFLANRMLADYVVQNILKKPSRENTGT